MPKYRIEIPIYSFLVIELEGEDEDEVLDNIPDDNVFTDARGGIAANTGRLYVSLDAYNWNKVNVEEING